MSNKLYIGNLPYRITENELKQAFTAYGDPSEVKIVLDRATGRSRGFGFITFASADEAKAALAMDGKEVQGRPLRVKLAEERERNGNGGGGGGGGGRRSNHRSHHGHGETVGE